MCSKAYAGILGDFDDRITKLLYLVILKTPPNVKTEGNPRNFFFRPGVSVGQIKRCDWLKFGDSSEK